jgi:hypothetical protein
MGLYSSSRLSASSYDKSCNSCKPQAAVAPLKFPNPNPSNYEILRAEQTGRNLVVEVRYPDCTNYEGRKILVFLKTGLKQLQDQGSIDPHFSNNQYMKSPFARFEPTERGWNEALRTAKMQELL